MRTAGLTCLVAGAISIFYGHLALWRYGKSLGNWPYRLFLWQVKIGVVLLVFSVPLLALSLIV